MYFCNTEKKQINQVIMKAKVSKKDFSLFTKKEWYFMNYDGRRKEFRGISRYQFEIMKGKHFAHIYSKSGWDKFFHACETRRALIEFFSKVPYIYSCDVLDDYSMYQRPCINGVGYVAICPGEPCNNVYVDDEILVTYLEKKYKKFLKKAFQ